MTWSAGARMVAPRFLKLWRMMMPCPESPARMTEFRSLMRRDSLALGVVLLDHADR